MLTKSQKHCKIKQTKLNVSTHCYEKCKYVRTWRCNVNDNGSMLWWERSKNPCSSLSHRVSPMLAAWHLRCQPLMHLYKKCSPVRVLVLANARGWDANKAANASQSRSVDEFVMNVQLTRKHYNIFLSLHLTHFSLKKFLKLANENIKKSNYCMSYHSISVPSPSGKQKHEWLNIH